MIVIGRKTYTKSNPAGDTPEMIQKCLNCPRATCTNCLLTTRRKHVGVDVLKKPEAFQRAFFEAYLDARDDAEIGQRLNKATSTIYKYRVMLNLPSIFRVPTEERRRIIEEWKSKQK